MEKEEILLSDSFEIFLKFLFGQKDYHQISGIKTTTEWKRVILKIIDSIEKSIKLTISNIDSTQKKRILNDCQNIKEQIGNSKQLNDLNEKTILGLFRLVFLLLGEIPDNWEYDKPYHSKHWTLNSKRQILYHQTLEQKTNLFLNESHRLRKFSEEENYNYFHDKLYNEFNSNHQKFLEWIKLKHPMEYLKIF